MWALQFRGKTLYSLTLASSGCLWGTNTFPTTMREELSRREAKGQRSHPLGGPCTPQDAKVLHHVSLKGESKAQRVGCPLVCVFSPSSSNELLILAVHPCCSDRETKGTSQVENIHTITQQTGPGTYSMQVVPQAGAHSNG